jgi:hypothetical protein
MSQPRTYLERLPFQEALNATTYATNCVLFTPLMAQIFAEEVDFLKAIKRLSDLKAKFAEEKAGKIYRELKQAGRL